MRLALGPCLVLGALALGGCRTGGVPAPTPVREAVRAAPALSAVGQGEPLPLRLGVLPVVADYDPAAVAPPGDAT